MEAEMKEIDEKLGKNAFSEDDNFDEAIPIQIRKEGTIPDHLVISEDEIADEALPIHIRKERKTKAYKETMIQYIETIDKNENSKKTVQKNK